MQFSKDQTIYNGYIFKIDGREWVVTGGKTCYIFLKSGNDRLSILRDDIIKGINDGSIKYMNLDKNT